MPRFRLGIALLACGLTSTVVARQQQPPRFRGGITLVTMDVTATGSDGWPVRDLRQDEVTLLVNGRERPIKSFELIEVAPRVPAGKHAATTPALVPASNAAPGSRNVFFVILHDHICPGQEHMAIEGAKAFIDQLAPRDRVAVLTMPFGRLEVDLTTDHARAKARLSSIVGHAQTSSGNQTTSETRALLDFVRGLAALEGAKTIVLMSAGLSGDGPQVFMPGDVATIAPDGGGSGLMSASTTLGESGGLRGAAAAARAQFYVIRTNTFPQCPGMPTSAKLPTSIAQKEAADKAISDGVISQESALATVASVTGGQYFALSARATGVFDLILRETSAYFAVAFEADADDLAGKNRRVEVRTSRPGVKIRARLTFPKAPAAATSTAASVRDMAASTVAYHELPLWAAAFPSRGPSGQLKIPIVVDSLERSWKESAFTIVASTTGKIVAAWPGDVPSAGPIIAAQTLPAGHYRLRAAVVDRDNRRGAVDYEFDAKLAEAGPLKLGAMMVGTVVDGKFQPRLVSAAGSTATAYFEIYGTAADVSVMFTLTKPEDDAPLATEAGDLTATRDADRRVATASIPLGDLPAGDYIVRASVSIGGQPAGSVISAVHVVGK